MYRPGEVGFVWSLRPHSETVGAYYYSFNASGVYPSNDAYRWHGFLIRCLAR